MRLWAHPAGGGCLSAICLFDKGVWLGFVGFFFLTQIKAAPGVMLPGGLAPCIPRSFTPQK